MAWPAAAIAMRSFVPGALGAGGFFLGELARSVPAAVALAHGLSTLLDIIGSDSDVEFAGAALL